MNHYFIYLQINNERMETDTFPIRLREARLMMGLSMEQLAERTGRAMTRQSILCYEKGRMHPKHHALQALVQALDISEAYFSCRGVQVNVPMLRSTSGNRLTEPELQAIEARLSFWAERYLEKERKAGVTSRFIHPMQGTAVATVDDAARAADLLRERWHCGDGPLPFLLRLMERKGIKILSTSLPEGILGLSTWADGKHPLMVLDMRPERTTTERLRFTAAHELAHLLLTFPSDSEFTEEKRCNQFAGFFLFPRRTFIDELFLDRRTTLTLPELIDLRQVYGLSIASLVHEAWDLRLISHEHYNWWYDEHINKNPLETGWGEYAYKESIGREKRVEEVIQIFKQERRCINNKETILTDS